MTPELEPSCLGSNLPNASSRHLALLALVASETRTTHTGGVSSAPNMQQYDRGVNISATPRSQDLKTSQQIIYSAFPLENTVAPSIPRLGLPATGYTVRHNPGQHDNVKMTMKSKKELLLRQQHLQNSSNCASVGRTILAGNLTFLGQIERFMPPFFVHSQLQNPREADLFRLRSIVMRKKRLQACQLMLDEANRVLDSCAQLEKSQQDRRGPCMHDFKTRAKDSQGSDAHEFKPISHCVSGTVEAGAEGTSAQKVEQNDSILKPVRRVEEMSAVPEKWLSRYNELKGFVKQNGHSAVSPMFQENKSLSRWMQRQRVRRRQEKLSDAQYQLLANLDFCWEGVQK